MAYFVGIDSGGTKTECWLGDATQVLGRAKCGSVKLSRVGEEVARERLTGLLRAVSEDAGVGLNAVTRTCAGMSGYSIARLREWMAASLAEQVSGDVEVCGDEEIALDAAFQGGPGILVIAGTGSNVIGRCGDGTRYTAGGWGPAIGDEGSGSWIGGMALRMGFTAMDRGVETGLLEAVRHAWGAANYAEIVGLAHAQPAPDFAALTPLVVRLAAQGDEIAAEVLTLAGRGLAEQVRMAWRRMAAHGEQSAQVACTGSVLEKIAPVREAMRARLPENVTLLPEAVNALEGALWRARR